MANGRHVPSNPRRDSDTNLVKEIAQASREYYDAWVAAWEPRAPAPLTANSEHSENMPESDKLSSKDV